MCCVIFVSVFNLRYITNVITREARNWVTIIAVLHKSLFGCGADTDDEDRSS